MRGGKWRVSPPARLGAMRTFRPSFPTQMTQETGQRPNSAAAAILPVCPHGVHGVTTTKRFRASARPPPQLRTPSFARHSRRFATQNRALGRFEGRKFGSHARRDRVKFLESWTVKFAVSIYANWSISCFIDSYPFIFQSLPRSPAGILWMGNTVSYCQYFPTQNAGQYWSILSAPPQYATRYRFE
jgi:hypothetical protein